MTRPGAVAELTRTSLPDEQLRSLDGYCRELARDLRAAGERLDSDPSAITEFLHLPAVAIQQHVLVPARYRPAQDLPLSAVAAGGSCVAWTIVAERLSYGDPGMVLASPGPSLSSAAVRALADEAQSDWFYRRVTSGHTWTCFGLTEPGKGSAATEITASLTPVPDGGWLLTGEKMYIGNGARAEVGVVFARSSPGPWGIEAVLVDMSGPGCSAQPLPSLGLRGAVISRLRFDQAPIPADRLLGRDRPRSRRGLHGARQTLLWFRPSVASLALGVTQAACDYVLEQRPRLAGWDRQRLDDLSDRSMRVRRLVYEAAAGIDAGAANPHRIGAAKMRAARLAEEAAMLAAELLGPASMIEHPWLDKTYRDARAFEFMEGTAHIHRRGVFQGLLRHSFFADDDPGQVTGPPAQGQAR